MYENFDWNNLYWQHSSRNYTYDHAKLRYGGPIPVFLYGDYRNWGFVNNACVNSEHSKDYKYDFGDVLTDEEFVRFNRKLVGNSRDPSFLFDMDPKKFDGSTPFTAKVQGNVFSLSLKALRDLDTYFRNGHLFQREIIFLDERSTKNKTDKFWAYTYFTRPSAVGVNINKKLFKFKHGYDVHQPPKIVRSVDKSTYTI
jgi:gamma-glutamylcyclotransferase (GGCT)/AIG2-like uncharacterized protein YtfP